MFCFSLVCIQNKDNEDLGIGIVKDFEKDEIYLISEIQIEPGYRLIKSKDFELAKVSKMS